MPPANTSDTLKLPNGSFGPHGGTQYSASYFDRAGVAADRATAVKVTCTEESSVGAVLATQYVECRTSVAVDIPAVRGGAGFQGLVSWAFPTILGT